MTVLVLDDRQLNGVLDDRRRRGADLLHAEHEVCDLVADARPHLLEDLHALAFVLDLWVDLGVAAQADRAAQVVHRVQVVFP